MVRVNGITQFLPATHTTILTLLRKHSPDATTRTRRRTSDIAYYSIYRPRKDERLSWPSWLTYSGRLTHISGHPSCCSYHHVFFLGGGRTGPTGPVELKLTASVMCGSVNSVQLNRKVMMTEADLERTDKKADAAEQYVIIITDLILRHNYIIPYDTVWDVQKLHVVCLCWWYLPLRQLLQFSFHFMTEVKFAFLLHIFLYACLSTCLSQKPHVQTSRNFLHFACGWCDMLRSSGFVDNFMLSHNGARQNQRCYV